MKWYLVLQFKDNHAFQNEASLYQNKVDRLRYMGASTQHFFICTHRHEYTHNGHYPHSHSFVIPEAGILSGALLWLFVWRGCGPGYAIGFWRRHCKPRGNHNDCNNVLQIYEILCFLNKILHFLVLIKEIHNVPQDFCYRAEHLLIRRPPQETRCYQLPPKDLCCH